MTLFEAVILGIVQGLSEFIPISSTAHLTITGKLMGLIGSMGNEAWTANIAVMQLGTIVAVFVYLRSDIKSMISSWVRENISTRVGFSSQSMASRQMWYVACGSIPIVVIGLALKRIIEGHITKDLVVISSALIVVAVILFLAERVATLKRTTENVTLRDALLIGVAQSLAVFPGVSRSGATLTAGLFLGFTRESALRFSFLLSIPAIVASGLLELYQVRHLLNADSALALLVATVVSGIVGYYSIAFLLRYLRNNSSLIFIVYRVALGGVILVAVNNGWIGK